jgi:hypothetical protein
MMGRRLTVWVVALGLRHGIGPNRMADLLRRTHRHRHSAWRWAVIGDAQTRNRRKERQREELHA